MTFMIGVKTNLAQVQRGMTNTAFQQVPFALARAVNQLAREVTVAELLNNIAVLDRPAPFTQNAVRVSPAKKGYPLARIFVQDSTERYLAPYEFGGRNTLNSKVLLKPIAEAGNLNQYGNLPRNRTAQLKGRKDVFVGTVKTKIGDVTGIWQRSTEEGKRVPVVSVGKTGKVRVRKTSKGVNTTGKLKLLIKFTDAHPIRQNLDWFGVAERLVDKRFNAVFGATLAQAIARSRP